MKYNIYILHIHKRKKMIELKDLMKNGAQSIVPKDLADMTLGEILSNPDVEVHKKGNVVRMKRKTSTESIMVEVRGYSDAVTVSESRASRGKPFNQMGGTIAKMRAEGKTQAEVADILGTTQTNISRIERQMKK